MPLQAMGEFAQVTEKLGPALELSGQPVKRGTMAHEHIVYMMLVDSAAANCDRKTIMKYAPKLEELASRDDHQPYLGVAYRAIGIAFSLSEDYDNAEKYLQQALEIFETLGAAWQVGRTLFEMAEVANGRDDVNRADEVYSQALESFESIGAQPDSVRVKGVISG